MSNDSASEPGAREIAKAIDRLRRLANLALVAGFVVAAVAFSRADRENTTLVCILAALFFVMTPVASGIAATLREAMRAEDESGK